jgi:lysophospholipase L1-like esterase
MWYFNRLFPGVAALAACLSCGHAQAQTPDAIAARSVVSMGDTARLQRFLSRARRGESVTVGVIGGSITQGASASTPERRWGNRVAQWLRERFPDTPIEFVNAGIGATSSDFGAHRVQAHLLVHNPDLVVVEYAVNDSVNPHRVETLEGLVRQLLSTPSDPAVMQLFTMNDQGGNVQADLEIVGRYYGLPMVSYRDGIWPEIEAGRMAWDDVGADNVHPNDLGHEFCAGFITGLLERVMRVLPEDEAWLYPVTPMPPPLRTAVFEHADLWFAGDLEEGLNQGWTVFDGAYGKAWQADEPGSELELTVPGRTVSLLYRKRKADLGRVEVRVDDGEPQVLEGFFPQDWGGGYTPCQIVAHELAPGPHRLRIRLLPERHADSGGHRFEVHAVMGAGE